MAVDRRAYATNFFQKLGYSPVQSAGIVGNLQHESGLRPTGAVGDNGTAFGVAQWRGDRFAALKRFAAERGTSWGDLDTQLSFVDRELKTTERAALTRLLRANNVQDAAAAFVGYERPQGWKGFGTAQAAHGWDNRFGQARETLALGGGTDSPPPAPADVRQLANAAGRSLSNLRDAVSKLPLKPGNNSFLLDPGAMASMDPGMLKDPGPVANTDPNIMIGPNGAKGPDPAAAAILNGANGLAGSSTQGGAAGAQAAATKADMLSAAAGGADLFGKAPIGGPLQAFGAVPAGGLMAGLGAAAGGLGGGGLAPDPMGGFGGLAAAQAVSDTSAKRAALLAAPLVAEPDSIRALKAGRPRVTA